MTVEAILQRKGRDVTTAWPWSTIDDATKRLAGPPRIGALVVLDAQQRVAGVLTERDLVRGMGLYGSQLGEMTVEALMSRQVPTCGPRDTLASVMHTMTERRFRHLPVVTGGELVGLVSIGDVVRAQLQDAQLEVAVLRDAVIAKG
jgi:CBS domain-containing protein